MPTGAFFTGRREQKGKRLGGLRQSLGLSCLSHPSLPSPAHMARKQEVTNGWMYPSVCNAKETSTWALEERVTLL